MKLLALVFLANILLPSIDTAAAVADTTTLLTCYTTSELKPSNIDANLCSHILLIGACDLYENGTLALPSDMFTQRYVELKRKNPALKLLITLKPDSIAMSKMAASAELRARFLTDVLAFMERNELDGFDFDWEFPAWAPTGGRAIDRLVFIQLLNETRTAFKTKNNYLLFVTVAAPYTIVDVSYDISTLNEYADYVQIMNYDFHVFSKSMPFTGFNAPVRAEVFEISVLSRMNSDYSTNYWVWGGLNASKLIFGIPTYARGYQLKSSMAHGLYAPAAGHSSYGETIQYSTVCAILRGAGGRSVTREWSDRAASPFLYADTDWISYENVKSVGLKADYALESKLAGIMVYALHTDDYWGVCDAGSRRETFPLTRTIRRRIEKQKKTTTKIITTITATVTTTTLTTLTLIVITTTVKR